MAGNVLLEENWEMLLKKVIKPLWTKKFQYAYKEAKMDENDFISMAGMELTKAFHNYNPCKSNMYTYAARVISNKAKTELRDCMNRDKRKAFHMASSLNKPLCDDSDEEMIDYIKDEHNLTDVNDNELSEMRVGNFVNSLSNQQLRVLILKLLHFETSDMPKMLNISKRTMSDILKGLKSNELTRVLYRRNF